ncbi:MAG: hypothetical protein ACRDGD_11485 [Candidatus Limnocylindria bacterium]
MSGTRVILMRTSALLLSALIVNGSLPHTATAGSRAQTADEAPRPAAAPIQLQAPPEPNAASPIPTFGRLYYTSISRATGGAPNVARDASWTNTYGLTSQRMLRATPSGGLSGGGNTANSMPTPSNAYMQQYYYQLTSGGTLAGYVRSIIRAARRDGTAIGDNQQHQAQMVIRVVISGATNSRAILLQALLSATIGSANYFVPEGSSK